MESLGGLRERRAFECRLTPDLALGSLDEADAFARERGLLTRTMDSALPSLYEACHEEPYQAGGHGFATWPATKWSWFGALIERGYLCAGVHRGKNLLVSVEIAALLDPICRAEMDRMRAADPSWRRLLDHLAVTGPSDIEDLRTELALKRQELKALRSPLERCGAIVARSVRAGEGHTHSSELARWDQVHPGASDGPGPVTSSATWSARAGCAASTATSRPGDLTRGPSVLVCLGGGGALCDHEVAGTGAPERRPSGGGRHRPPAGRAGPGVFLRDHPL